MFVRLTRKDGTPIWLNANLVVTIEAVRNGGSIVVPVGDGLDYEVRESVEKVIPMVEDAQDHVGTMPVPTTDALAVSPPPVLELDVGAEPAVSASAAPPVAEKKPEPTPEPTQDDAAQVASPTAEPPPEQPNFEAPDAVPEVSATEAASAVTAVAAIKAEIDEAESADGKKPAKRVRKTRTKPVPASTPATAGERKLPARRRATVRRTPLELTEEEVARLRVMAPRNVKRILNTLKAQFKVSDAESTVKALIEHGIISVDENGRATWLPEGG